MTRFSAFLIIAGCLTTPTTCIQAAPDCKPAQVCNTLAMQDPLFPPDTVHASAANLTTDSTASEGKPKKKDLINRLKRKKNFAKQDWYVHPRSGNLVLPYKGDYITIIKSKYGSFGIAYKNKYYWKYRGRNIYDVETAKQAAFELFDEYHN